MYFSVSANISGKSILISRICNDLSFYTVFLNELYVLYPQAFASGDIKLTKSFINIVCCCCC